MEPIRITLERGKKWVIAQAIDWPGWCRRGRDDDATAIQTLIDYAPRYAAVLNNAGTDFPADLTTDDIAIIETHQGNASTDFGGPGTIPAVHEQPIDGVELDQQIAIIQACWAAFDAAISAADGLTLTTGPRGGGRQIPKMIDHVIESDRAYLRKISWKVTRDPAMTSSAFMHSLRDDILTGLAEKVAGNLPEIGPRGGSRWPARAYIARVCWHTLDHAWEIEDRLP